MIPRTKANYGLRDLLAALRVTDAGPDHRARLRDQLSRHLGGRPILLTPSGRGGLYYLLKATDRPRVLVPAYTCKAVVEAARLAGKDVGYLATEAGGFNLDPQAVAREADARTVVLATHQFGIPCRIAEIVALCRERQALVIEDAAAALGTRIDGRPAGTFGDAAVFSFDSTKLVTVPLKGGFLTVADADRLARVARVARAEARPMSAAHKLRLLALASLLVLLENHRLYWLFHTALFRARGRFTTDTPALNLARTPFYVHELANWQAFLAARQVAHLPALIAKRQRLYRQLIDALHGCRALELPPADPDGDWACIRFPLRVRGDKLAFYERALRRGVDFAFSFTYLAAPEACDDAARLARAVLDPPFYDKLSDAELHRVVSVIRAVDEEFDDGP